MGTHDPRNQAQTPDGWVTLPGGGIVPEKLNRATGWQGDRDVTNTAQMIAARRAMVRAVVTYREVSARMFVPGVDMAEAMMATVRAADVVMECWTQFDEITGGAEA